MHWKCLNPTAMVTDVTKWFWGPPASKMSNSNWSKQGQVVGMQPAVGYFYYSVNINWAAQNPWLGRIMACDCGLDIGGLEIGLCVCLAIAGVATSQRPRATFLIVLQQSATSCTLSMGTHEHNPISSSLTYFCLARFIVNITYHQYENNRTLQGIYC